MWGVRRRPDQWGGAEVAAPMLGVRRRLVSGEGARVNRAVGGSPFS